MGSGWHTECAGGTLAEGGRNTTRTQSELWGVGLARGACRRLLRNALGAATVMAVAWGVGGRDRRPTWEGLAHGEVCLQVTMGFTIRSTILRP